MEETTNKNISDELESLRKTMFEEFDKLKQKLSAISESVHDMTMVQKVDHELLVEHDDILVRGTPSLQETVRNQTKELTTFIQEMREERAKRKELEEKALAQKAQDEKDEKKRKRDELNKWKWTGIGLFLTFFPPFLYQAILAWESIAKLLTK